MPFGLGKFPVDSPSFLIGARVIPGYGSKFVSLISGFYRVLLLRGFLLLRHVTSIAKPT